MLCFKNLLSCFIHPFLHGMMGLVFHRAALPRGGRHGARASCGSGGSQTDRRLPHPLVAGLNVGRDPICISRSPRPRLDSVSVLHPPLSSSVPNPTPLHKSPPNRDPFQLERPRRQTIPVSPNCPASATHRSARGTPPSFPAFPKPS